MVGLMLLIGLPLGSMAANSKKKIAQVAEAVTISENWDYTVTGDEPFAEGGSIDIVNTEHAVVILEKVKPSAAIKLLAKYVTINGAKAVNNSNCQVKIYNCGAIILPYPDKQMLTVYSEPDFGGESVNSFTTKNTGGYMNTLKDAELNNKIRSFKLKRGYMVTFSTQASGRGYSRCFIAADNDLEVASLPDVLDQKISSYRVFKWYDTGKKQLANYMDKTALNALNVQSSYDWGQGNSSFLPDYEWVPNHIYEDWPSSATIGGTSQSPHTKNNNEPRNSSDDHPQDLKTILDNWENMMRTGLRLCSPASWDGSDYWNATGFLAEFLDSIDARGWRCDIIDLHCYWPEGNFGNIANWSNKYKRPVWISEWCWGASWNKNGAFAAGVTKEQVKTALQGICTKLNSYAYVERYYYWNSEADISKLYLNGKLTPAGEYYASMTSPLAYNGKYDFIPTTPRQYAPSKFKEVVGENKKVTKLTWYDSNGEYNRLMEVQKKTNEGLWVTLETIAQKEAASNYTYNIPEGDDGTAYRLHVIDLNGKEYYTNDALAAGDAIEIDGKTYYVGGNLLPNGEFNLGFTGWTSGTGAALAEPQFQVVRDGGYHEGAYLQSHMNGGSTTASSVKTVVDVVPGQNYVFRAASINSGNNMKLYLSADGTSLTNQVAKLSSSDAWNMESFTFNTDTYSKAIVAFYSMAALAQADALALYQLFDSRDAAIADGLTKLQLKAEAQKQYYSQYTALNDDLTKKIQSITAIEKRSLDEAEMLLDYHRIAGEMMPLLDQIEATLKAVEQKPCPYYETMKQELKNAKEATTVDDLLKHLSTLDELTNTYLSFTRASKQPKFPSFANEKATGWETVVGTFTGGDQKATTKFDKTCWNAWWSTTQKTATMEIRQTVSDLPEGYYVLECQATTEHFCISDQHGYLKCGDQTVVTPTLSMDYFDLPVGNVWETLNTTPIYVPAKGSVTLGFVSSKNGAHSGWWHAFGNVGSKDNREGWWCATGFQLKYHAIDDLSGITTATVAASKPDGTYTLDGRRVNDSQLSPGLYIKVIDGKASKITVK